MPWSTLNSSQNLLATELNSLASGARALSVAVTGNTATFANFQLTVTFEIAPALQASIAVFILPSIDGGSTYADGSPTVNPQIPPSFILYCNAVATTQQLGALQIALPPGNFKVLLRNDTSQSFAASGNVLAMATFSPV